jgi:hypothetical protein
MPISKKKVPFKIKDALTTNESKYLTPNPSKLEIVIKYILD